VLKPVTKYSASVGATHQINEVLANAFRAAESGRPGAAYVNLPQDMMAAPCGQEPLPAPAFSGSGPADSGAIAEAARLINAASNPVVVLGMLASAPANSAALRTFLTKNSLPVVGTFQAAGAVGPEQLDNFGGRIGQLANQPADRLLDSGDLVITVGYDPVEYWPSLWNATSKRKIVLIDVLPASLDNCYLPSVELLGDIAATLEALTSQTQRSGRTAASAAILDQIKAERDKLAAESASRGGYPVHPLRLVHELQQFLSGDVTVCMDVGSLYMWIARHLYSFRPRQVLISNAQQPLGIGLPWAIAASIVRPAEKVLSVSGDGGFLFSAMELETAVRFKANFVHLVWISESYDMVAAQELLKYGRVSGTVIGPIDYIKFAEAFGATGLMINKADQIAPVMKKAFDTPGPVIVGVHVDYSDNKQLFESLHEGSIH
jgi:acetolactate synthase-1/2/3 large subunit